MKTSITGHAHLLCYEAKDLIVGIAFINLNLMEWHIRHYTFQRNC